MKKADLLALIEAMPDEIDQEELLYRIYLLAKITACRRDMEAGRLLSHEEVMREARAWRR